MLGVFLGLPRAYRVQGQGNSSVNPANACAKKTVVRASPLRQRDASIVTGSRSFGFAGAFHLRWRKLPARRGVTWRHSITYWGTLGGKGVSIFVVSVDMLTNTNTSSKSYSDQISNQL